ncbi:type I methionyl aminopeptidase [Aureibacter tunicatorum]|uniref:Methionine aminopeptidase n=1 Tax=Aureibacter tunicatorum TaxID=866807 RepID=A0AAE3XKA6_9BACT|nr:type I methionyl aminopeptidase [Aureibacter tunicatorum]MDR6237982.1 methionyl aminopeptidase [Aureibacter tunicatorum]BDD03015.1 methionine aminopeptidase [Aureibacter tunicatorum]
MIKYKTEKEIQLIKESAEILGKAHGLVASKIKPGVSTLELDQIAYDYIVKEGGKPSFKGYNGFPFTLCISVNENVVHGFPSDYKLKDGDIISVDCGVFYKGFHSDCAYTYPVGEVDEEVMDLLKRTKESLYIGIEQAKEGKRIGDIGFEIQKYCEGFGYGVVRELVGHGLGRNLHESPEVPNFGIRGKGPKLKSGLVIAIEPMINLGTKQVVLESDGWTIRTTDRKPSAHFEHTVGIINGQTEILTTHKYIEEYFNI